MGFPGALTLTDLNDFLSPSQACIKPVEQTNKSEKRESEASGASTEIRIDSNGTYYEVGVGEIPLPSGSSSSGEVDKKDTKTTNGKKLEQAQISLTDCLACSGCITSAESVLITLQSHTEVLATLAANPPTESPRHRTSVFSIAPQSLASLVASLNASTSKQDASLTRVLRRVRAFCSEVLGARYVCDTSFARDLALREHVREFSNRLRKKAEGGEEELPMLASACPGWVCYAEKAHAEMLPFISRTKSPQQIMGVLAKEWLARSWGLKPDQIYHVSIMPCYDKKLEASRSDFYNDLYHTRDVDCVITSGELELMMKEKGWDLSQPVEGEDLPTPKPLPQNLNDKTPYFPELITHLGSSSGSYLHSLIEFKQSTSPVPLELSTRSIRSADHTEYTLTERESRKVIFRGAACYGFRNLQNVVRKVGRAAGVQVGRGAAGKLGGGLRARAKKGVNGEAESGGYDYVEVMACPGGCVNGGGQLRPPSNGEQIPAVAEGTAAHGGFTPNAKWGDREWVKKVEAAYWNVVPSIREGLEGVGDQKEIDLAARTVFRELFQPTETHFSEDWSWESGLDPEAEERRTKLFRTQYRAVENPVVGLAVKW